MENITDIKVLRLVEDLDAAVLSGDVRKADALTDALFRLRNGSDGDAVMPEGFLDTIAGTPHAPDSTGGRMKKSKNIKRIVTIAAAAALVTALTVTALATRFFGIRDLVISSGAAGSPAVSAADPSPVQTETAAAAAPSPSQSPKQDLIVLQGYPDSPEYKAAAAWNTFCAGYDTDHKILDQVGNSSNEYTEKYPMYLVYSKDMADKLSQIADQYGLKLHTSMTIVESADALYKTAGTGRFLDGAVGGSSGMLGGYVYNDGTFHYDGQAVLSGGIVIDYQLGNYIKGTFSDTYLNIGDAGAYKEWQYATKSGVTVSLALSDGKALVIADLKTSFVTVNVLSGTSGALLPGAGTITAGQLEQFADSIDFSKINR
jgi:hypothetical protein